MRPFGFFLCLLCFGTAARAQDGGSVWTLDRAVSYAYENNLQVRRLDNLAESSRLQAAQARNNRLPNISANVNSGLNFGRQIDPATNTFDQQTIAFQSMQIGGNVAVYNGGLIKNSLRQAELNQAAAETEARVNQNNIGLQVANSYLTIVLLKEQLANARAQLALTEDQLANTDRLIQAGSVAPAQRFDLLAQVAANQRQVVELENQEINAKISLQLLLELDPDDGFQIATPELDPTRDQLFEPYDANQVLQLAQNTQPTVRAAQLRQEAAAVDLEIARAGMRPTVSLFGNISANFSSGFKDFQNPDDSNVELVQGPAVPVVIDGMPSTLAQFSVDGLTFPNLGYFDQLDRNFGQSVGVVLAIPIYSQGRNRTNVQLADLQRQNAALDVEQADNQLRNDVLLALADLRAARESYRASEVSLEAAQAAYDNTDRLFRAGAANSLDVVTATNRLDQARTEFTRSKFQLIFNRQVIEFYLGNPLAID